MSEMGQNDADFHTTRWTMVMCARGEAPEAKAALSELCEHYWTPVFRFLCREGRSDDESRELAQAFFARVLARNSFEQVDPAKGRFRSYLLGALKHFLAEQRRNANRQKRGGDVAVVSIDAGGTETSPGIPVPDPANAPSDTYFDRAWALEVMDRSLTRVQRDFDEAGKAEHFETLKPWLIGDTEDLSQSDAAAALNLSTGAIKVAIHRLRKNFGAAIQSEIAETLEDPEAVREELRYLIEVLG